VFDYFDFDDDDDGESNGQNVTPPKSSSVEGFNLQLLRSF
jgi:hypothetical protein